MAHYSIYIPGGRGASPNLLNSVGLGDLQLRQQWDWCEAKGPDGGDGAIGTVFDQRAKEGSMPLMGYHKDRQQWRPSVINPKAELPKGAFWYGFEPERPPTPVELAHRTQINGWDVVLQDKAAWRIPESLQLPMDIGHDEETGELVRMYSHQYEKFCRQAEKYVFVMFEHILALETLRHKYTDIPDDEIHVDFQLADAWDYCAMAMSINYRVASPVLGRGFLNLLDERSLAQIIRATLSMPAILEVIEKKNLTSPSSIHVGLSTEPGD